MEALLLTVWHTGTKYFTEGLTDHYARLGGRASYSHLNDGWERKIHDKILYTTYRDPYQVAASWINRRHNFTKGVEFIWMNQWSFYAELESYNPIVLDFTKGRVQHGMEFGEHPVNSYPDETMIKLELKKGNIDYFYRKVPKHAIEHALACSEWARDRQNQLKEAFL